MRIRVMLAVIYARHSTDRQATSTQDQLARCRAFAEIKEYDVLEEFSDEAISGANPISSRPGIKSLRHFIETTDFDRIICEDLSRLSRNMSDIAGLFDLANYHGVDIETVTEGIITELHIGLKGTMNALYLKDLGDKTKRGMIAAATKGKPLGGRAYGYKIVKKITADNEVISTREIDQDQAAVVKSIFDMYEQGQTALNICRYLNAQGIPSPKGKQWQPSVLTGTNSRKSGMLRQPLYVGKIVFNKLAYRKDPATGKRTAIVNDQSEHIKAVVPELAIISEAQFERVQQLLQQRPNRARIEQITLIKTDEEHQETRRLQRQKYRAAAAKDKERIRITYLTSNKLWCTHCDTKIVTQYNNARGGHDGCKNRCDKHKNILRNHSIEKTLIKLKKITVGEILEFNEITDYEIRLIKIQREKEKYDCYKLKISQIMYSLGGSIANLKETGNQIKELEKKCLRHDYNIEKLATDLDKRKPLTPEEAKLIHDQFMETIAKSEASPLDKQDPATTLLNSLIHQIRVTDKIYYDVDIDIENLVMAFR
jgi:DNA invertase Pin-like site-specific DNA recombinase